MSFKILGQLKTRRIKHIFGPLTKNVTLWEYRWLLMLASDLTFHIEASRRVLNTRLLNLSCAMRTQKVASFRGGV